jgi:hypothetical protein
MQSAFQSLPDVVKFEVAQLLGNPSFTMFIETAILHLQRQQINMVRPQVSDATRCQQYVAECMSMRDKEWQLRELLQIAQTEFDTTDLETE